MMQVKGKMRIGGLGGRRASVDLNQWELTDYAVGFATGDPITSAAEKADLYGSMTSRTSALTGTGDPPTTLPGINEFLKEWVQEENAKASVALPKGANDRILPGPDLRSGIASLIDRVTQPDGEAIIEALKGCYFKVAFHKAGPWGSAWVSYFDRNSGKTLNDAYFTQGATIKSNPVYHLAKLNIGHIAVLAKCWADTKVKQSSAFPLSSSGPASSSAPGDENVEAPERESAGTLPEAPAPTPNDRSDNTSDSTPQRHQNGSINSPNSKVFERARARGSDDGRWAYPPTAKEYPSDAYAA